jgi:hypothetical protein
MTEAMLDCVLCGNRKWLALNATQSEQLRSIGTTQLPCSACQRETAWILADYSRTSHAPAEPPAVSRPLDSGGIPQQPPVSPSTPAPGAVPQPAASRPSQENRRSGGERRQASRRKSERASLRLPLRIRVDTINLEFSEITTTLNVSRSGIYFQSNKPYTEGLRVRVTLNYSPENAAANIEQLAIIVRVSTNPKTGMNGVAVKYI